MIRPRQRAMMAEMDWERSRVISDKRKVISSRRLLINDLRGWLISRRRMPTARKPARMLGWAVVP